MLGLKETIAISGIIIPFIYFISEKIRDYYKERIKLKFSLSYLKKVRNQEIDFYLKELKPDTQDKKVELELLKRKCKVLTYQLESQMLELANQRENIEIDDDENLVINLSKNPNEKDIKSMIELMAKIDNKEIICN